MIYKATVISITNGKTINVRINEGPVKNKVVAIDISAINSLRQIDTNKGDALMVSYSRDGQGKESAYIADFYRNDALMILTVLFVLVVAWIGRMRGVMSLLGMIISFFILTKGLLPSILQGNDPVLIMLLGSILIIPITFYISHGINRKTTIAIVSTFLTLVITAALSYAFVILAKLTGFNAEEAVFLQAQGFQVNMRSILLAGIILGAMGVLDDITISQVSIVETLRKSNKSLSKWDLYKHAMNVGRDHISSLVNTLFLVYAGAALPLFLLFYGNGLRTELVINQEVVATEIVRTLVSSIGIILAVPLASYIAAHHLHQD